MARRTRWLVVAIVAAVIAAAFLTWRGCRPAPADAPVVRRSFAVDSVPVDSPDLEVGPAVVRATSYRGYTEWACLLECLEPEGCRAEVRLVLDWVGDGGGGRMIVTGAVDAEPGETMRIGRVQRPPIAGFDRVDRLALEVTRLIRADAPTPFIID